MVEPLKSALHHWWPRSLSQEWADAADGVSRITPDGKVMRFAHHQLGAINNAHHIKIGHSPSVWDSSFESAFGAADDQFPALVEWLCGLPSSNTSHTDFSRRFTAYPATTEEIARLAECVASLAARIPSLRAKILRTIEHYQTATHLTAPAQNNERGLVPLSMKRCQHVYSETLRQWGKFCILYSDEAEFIYGDGLLHNLGTDSRVTSLNPKCLTPVTPTIAVVYNSPMSCWSFPRIMTIRLRRDEVDIINSITQIYSKDYLFFRSAAPALTEEFTRHQFLEIRYDAHPWLDGLMDRMANTSFDEGTLTAELE